MKFFICSNGVGINPELVGTVQIFDQLTGYAIQFAICGGVKVSVLFCHARDAENEKLRFYHHCDKYYNDVNK